MTDYFSDRQIGSNPRIEEKIDQVAWDGILSLIQIRINNGSLAHGFPSHCPDGNAIDGTDERAFLASVGAEIHVLASEHPYSWVPPDSLPSTLALLDFIELYHRAECLTHVGDSQAVRSLTQCGEPMRFAMAAPIDLRNDFDSVSLRRLAKRTRDATQSRRLLALAEVYDGGSRTDASRIGGVGLQIIRDWVLRFNARGPDGLVDGKSPGAPSKLNADHRRALAEVVEAGPVPAVDGVVRWRRKDLARWLLETFAISLDETTVGRELKALGFAKISARPRHYAQNELAVEAFKKKLPRRTGEDPGEAPERRRDRAVVAR